MKRILVVILMVFSVCYVMADEKTKTSSYESLDEKSRLDFEFLFMEGLRYKLNGNVNEALKCFDNCLKLYPESAAVKYEVASILILNEDYNTALQLMREAVVTDPSNIWYKLLLADIFQRKAMIDEAGDVYADLIKKYPRNEEYYIIEAGLYISVEKWEKALNVFNRYEKEFGITEPVSLEKVKLYMRMDDSKKASAELTKLIEKFPEKEEYLSLLAELYFNYNQDKKGLQILNKLLKSNPDNGFVHLFLADYYFSKDEIKEANKHIQKAFTSDQLDNNYKVQYLLRLAVQNDTTKVTESVLDSYMALLIDKYSDDLSVRMLYSDFLKKDNKIREAREQLEYILSIEKDNYGVWEELLLTCYELMDTTCLIAKSKEAILYFPEQPLPYTLGAIGYMLQKNYIDAIPLLEDGIKYTDDRMPLKSQLYSHLGDCYYNTDSVEIAFQMYDNALSLSPDDVIVLNNYAYYLSLREESLDKAERMSGKVIQMEPNNATYLDTHAWVLFKRKAYSQALYYMKLAMEKEDEPSGVLYEHYGDILYMNSEKEEALKMWKKAKEMIDEEVSENLDSKILGTYRF